MKGSTIYTEEASLRNHKSFLREWRNQMGALYYQMLGKGKFPSLMIRWGQSL